MKPLYYLAHPVGPNKNHTYQENMQDGILWWTALLRAGWNVCAPWVGLCHALDDTDPHDRQLGMAQDIEVMLRCDGIVACGDVMSEGMLKEWNLMDGKIRINAIGQSREQFQAWSSPDEEPHE